MGVQSSGDGTRARVNHALTVARAMPLATAILFWFDFRRVSSSRSQMANSVSGI